MNKFFTAAAAAVVCMAMTGCSCGGNDGTADQNTSPTSTAQEEETTRVEDTTGRDSALGDVADGIGEAGEDIIDGASDIADDMEIGEDRTTEVNTTEENTSAEERTSTTTDRNDR